MLATQIFRLPAVSTQFGCGSIRQLASLVATMGYSRAFVITDAGVASTGVIENIERILLHVGVTPRTFDGILSNPGTDTLDIGAHFARAFDPGVIVACGGGSVLDSAKGIALMATNDGAACDFDYRNPQAQPAVPIIAIPTTAGTGAETNGFGVIGDPATGRKFYVGHESAAPYAVILDPELTRGLPARQTAATGLDVLAHAFESLSSRGNNPYAEGINLQVAGMVFRFLPRATEDGQDLEARSQLLLAAHMAGLAFATTGLGMAHALAHALSAHLGVPHGVALAVLLDHVLTFNLPARSATYARVALAVGTDDGRQDEQTNADAAIDAVRALVRTVGLPRTLAELGLTQDLIPHIAADALADEVMTNTPRMPTEEDLRAILLDAL